MFPSIAQWSATHLYPGVAEHFSETPLVSDRPAPLLGEHNRKVFSEILGMSDAEIEGSSATRLSARCRAIHHAEGGLVRERMELVVAELHFGGGDVFLQMRH